MNRITWTGDCALAGAGGYNCLGDVGGLSGEVVSAFSNTVNAAALKVRFFTCLSHRTAGHGAAARGTEALHPIATCHDRAARETQHKKEIKDKRDVSCAPAVQVARGVVLARPGLEERVRIMTSLQEVVRILPPDLFRTCLARVRSPPVKNHLSLLCQSRWPRLITARSSAVASGVLGSSLTDRHPGVLPLPSWRRRC